MAQVGQREKEPAVSTTEISLRRNPSTVDTTIGVMTWPDGESCLTLEDVVRPGDIFKVKVPGETAIPAGRYQILLTWSPRFGRNMPEVVAVPNFVGIRVHSGNYARDTEGCILTGQTRGDNFIGQSRLAFTWFMWKLEHALKLGQVFITIQDAS
jgi:hypothetical protein